MGGNSMDAAQLRGPKTRQLAFSNGQPHLGVIIGKVSHDKSLVQQSDATGHVKSHNMAVRFPTDRAIPFARHCSEFFAIFVADVLCDVRTSNYLLLRITSGARPPSLVHLAHCSSIH